MADDNRPLKYTRYAIGEIVLVVIGILIALQINNWNETQKSKKKFIRLLEDVQKELILNINQANNIIANCRNRDMYTYNINNRLYTIEDYKENRRLTRIILWEYPFSIIDNAFNNLIEAGDNNLLEFQWVINDLKNLYVTQKHEIESTNQDEKKMVYDFLNYLRDTKDWYSIWNLYYFANNNYTDEIYNYFISDPSYLNFASDYTVIATQQKFEQTHFFRANALESYKAIDKILIKEKKNHVIISPMPTYNAIDYDHFVGSYESEWGVAEIEIIDNKLLYTWTGTYGDDFTTEIIPTSESEFTIELAGQAYLYSLLFNENDKVIGKRSHIGVGNDSLMKIR